MANIWFLRTLVMSLNSLFCDPLPLSKRWIDQIKEYFEKINKEYKIQFPEKEVTRNCVRKKNFMCPFVEITSDDCCHCVVPERTIKTACFRTKTDICPYKHISKFACDQCEIPNSFRDPELDKIIKEIREEIQEERRKEMPKVNPERVCPFTHNTVCYNATKDDSACINCSIRKKNEMLECGEVVKMKCFHTNKDDRFFWSKDGTDKYLKYQKYWGGIITNKPSRTKEKYASRISIDGTRKSNINEEDFKKIFAPMCDHIYEDKCDHRQEIKLTTEMCDMIFKNMLTNDNRLKLIFSSLSSKECEIIFDELLEHSKIYEKYFIRNISLDVQNLNGERLIILKKK